MSTMTHAEARQFLQNLFDCLFNPVGNAEDLAAWFSTDYRQFVDGKCLDYQGFMAHVRVLKQTLRSGKVTFEKVITDGTNIADVHIVEAIKTNGSRLKSKVIALFEIRDGKVSSVDELTHLLEGDSTDHDIGSRI